MWKHHIHKKIVFEILLYALAKMGNNGEIIEEKKTIPTNFN